MHDPRTLAFFTVHSSLDIEHSNAEREMIAVLAPSEEEQRSVLDATSDALDAWWSFLDGVDVPTATAIA